MLKIILALVLFFMPFAAQAQNTASPVVLELFTSQGCAFCPPADALLGKLATQNGIIALSCHVDYFQMRGPSLGQRFCTARQNDYTKILKGGQRFTPQLIVNGKTIVIGSEADKVSAAILKARSQKLMPIVLQKAPNPGYYYFTLPQMNHANGDLRMGMFIYDVPQKHVITQGSNFGKTITYSNVVSRFVDMGVWDGLPTTRTINANFVPQNAGVAILIQNIRTGEIVAAGQAPR